MLVLSLTRERERRPESGISLGGEGVREGSSFRDTKCCEPPEGDLGMNRISRQWGRVQKGMSTSIEVKCEVIIDQAEGRQPPRENDLPRHRPLYLLLTLSPEDSMSQIDGNI